MGNISKPSGEAIMIPIRATIQYTQEKFNDDMANLCEMLEGNDFDLIVGINRGGCLPAVCLSHHLKIPATMIDYSTRDGVNISPQNIVDYFSKISDTYKHILLVDDLVDSGVSMTRLVSVAKAYCKQVSVATLLRNTDIDVGVPHFAGTTFSRQTEPRYFDFWWEVI